MCLFKNKSAPAPVITPPPVKSSADIQLETEEERKRLGFTTRGLAATILTAGLGDSSAVPTRGVVLGGY